MRRPLLIVHTALMGARRALWRTCAQDALAQVGSFLPVERLMHRVRNARVICYIYSLLVSFLNSYVFPYPSTLWPCRCSLHALLVLLIPSGYPDTAWWLNTMTSLLRLRQIQPSDHADELAGPGVERVLCAGIFSRCTSGRRRSASSQHPHFRVIRVIERWLGGGGARANTAT